MERDLGDILDRATIACLKAERIESADSIAERDFFMGSDEIEGLSPFYWKFFDILRTINSNIWRLEAQLKSGKDCLPNPAYLFSDKNTDVLVLVGALSILIRDWNGLRVQIKNVINLHHGEGFQDHKKDHLSE